MFRLIRLNPPHGWSAVAWELIIVTLGVLMALGAQQLVERFASRNRAERAEQRIERELDENQGIEVERVAIRTCLTDRLRELANGLAAGRSRWTALPANLSFGATEPALRKLYDAPTRNWLTDAYDEAVAQGDLKELNPEQRFGLASMYGQIRGMARLHVEEKELEAKLAPLQYNPALSSAERNSLISTIARLDQVNGLIVHVSRQTFKQYRELGFADTPQEMAEFRRSGWWENSLADYRRRYGSCVDPRAVAELDPELLPLSLR